MTYNESSILQGDDLELSEQTDPIKLEVKMKTSALSSKSASLASIPSTSGASTRSAMKHPMIKSASFAKMDPKTAKLLIDMKTSKILADQKGNLGQSKKVPPPFKKAQSQSHLHVKSIQATTHVSIEHEKRKLKKSRSFDKNLAERHMIDSKKVKTKH